MKIPREVSGEELIRRLGGLGYKPTRQTGSHARLSRFPLLAPPLTHSPIHLLTRS